MQFFLIRSKKDDIIYTRKITFIFYYNMIHNMSAYYQIKTKTLFIMIMLEAATRIK